MKLNKTETEALPRSMRIDRVVNAHSQACQCALIGVPMRIDFNQPRSNLEIVNKV